MSFGGAAGKFKGGFKGVSRGPNGVSDIPDDLVISYTPTPLYPDFSLPQFPSPIDSKLEDLVSISLKFKKDLESSVHYILPVKSVVGSKDQQTPFVDGIERYSDRFKPKRTRIPLSRLDTNLSFFPSELHMVKDPTKRSSKKQRGEMTQLESSLEKNLQDLEQQELLGKENGKKESPTGDGDEDEEAPADEDYDEEMMEEEGDYLVDYYDDEMDAIGNDSDGGGNDDYS